MRQPILNSRPAHILLVEDDPDDQAIVKRAFEQGRIQNKLYIVEDGQEALDFLKHAGRYSDPKKSPRPDLVLLDLNLPGIDGRTVLEEIRKTPELKTLAVVVLTTSKQEEDILRSYKLGCNSFITKPVGADNFIDAIRKLEEYWFQVVVLP